ncbi:D-tagatose-bisphosphate aldolase, class II, non-catalytic subunit [Pengzhenrongella sicca]|uniref:D-tagatose-bisphosphate aldolase, class II, non-catalytic subunit n=1 Tax=Pengzhenrongella sicca TaxID=2819238 RepID=A0A8A4ZHA7_9MICO|nr:D-tagatose-bisphosphate aldolase, class II, non-catalytic subunit [Pengzhenrongella sicca]
MLLDTIHRHKAGASVGVPSVCSAHPLVLEAAVLQALQDGGSVLVEATSNQVDQFGGYTGMRPEDFRDLVYAIADRVGLPRARVVLGGDHLGPNTWRGLGAEAAMDRADGLVAAYVAAGFSKIHLDCSMACAGDSEPLTDDVVAGRAARLASIGEATALREFGVSEVLYVIGTEVPVPGGAHETIEQLAPTSDDAARVTLARHEKAFADAGLAGAWDRVVGLVVQPGVEFDHARVVDYDRERTTALQRVVDGHPNLVFEAHSTDYQTTERLAELVEDHWAILKVGPGLTFALREALFALAAIEDELVADCDRSDLVAVVERRMLADPHWWQSYYEGDDGDQRLARRYSYSDRVRYYWPDPEIHAAEVRLLSNLSATHIPLPLLSQYLPDQYARVRRGEVAVEPAALAIDRVRDVLRDYALACNPTLRSAL